MSIVVPYAGARILLNQLLDQYSVYCHLYVNDPPLGPTTTAADLVEASWVGYEPIIVSTWTDAQTVNGLAVTYADPAVWTYGAQPGPTTVYGYWLADLTGTLLQVVERRPQGPITLALPTDQIAVYPRLTLRQDPMPG